MFPKLVLGTLQGEESWREVSFPHSLVLSGLVSSLMSAFWCSEGALDFQLSYASYPPTPSSSLVRLAFPPRTLPSRGSVVSILHSFNRLLECVLCKVDVKYLLTEFACAHVLVYMTFNFICSPDGQWYLRNAELFNKKYGLIKPYFPGVKSHAFLQKKLD